MQIILSPAKLMNFTATADKLTLSQPLFAEKTAELAKVCKRLSVSKIVEKMALSNEMAHNVYGFFQTFGFENAPQLAAALAYNGIAYKGLNAHDFSDNDFHFAQQHLNIISGLYGIVRPLDAIKPYRLEMARKIVPKNYKSLYDFWQNTLNSYLSEKLVQNGNTIINVASREYSKVLKKTMLPKGTKIVEINFLEQENDRLKQIVVHTKKARGLISRFIIKNKIMNAEEIKAFDYENYFFYPKLSKEDYWVFVR